MCNVTNRAVPLIFAHVPKSNERTAEIKMFQRVEIIQKFALQHK